VKLKANQLAEIKQFDVEHLTGMDKFKYDLPKTSEDFKQAIKDMKFQLFNEKLQQAAQFADDVGGAFGKLASDLAEFKNPLTAFKDFLTNLAATFTKNFIEKPITDWATQHIGIPAAKQGFGKDLNKLAGDNALSLQELNVALAQATGNLGALQAAAQTSSTGMSSVTTAAQPVVRASRPSRLLPERSPPLSRLLPRPRGPRAPGPGCRRSSGPRGASAAAARLAAASTGEASWAAPATRGSMPSMGSRPVGSPGRVATAM
jgi:hypothetical protein